jgi:phosphinothricin acetyltransferase
VKHCHHPWRVAGWLVEPAQAGDEHRRVAPVVWVVSPHEFAPAHRLVITHPRALQPVLTPDTAHSFLPVTHVSRREVTGPAADARYSVRVTADSAAAQIAPAALEDLPAIVGILNEAAANSIATFATRPVTVAERRDWFGRFSEAGPARLLVARRGDQVLGYACSQPYRDHEAFRETVEVSIALDIRHRGQGIGSALYRALLDGLAREPSVHVVVAGIALPNDASVALHRKFGFTDVGTFREYAMKNGQYISSLWMQRLSRP